MTKGDHEDAYRQLPMSTRDGRAAVATLRDSRSEELYGVAPKTQLLGWAAAVLRYNCFSPMIRGGLWHLWPAEYSNFRG